MEAKFVKNVPNIEISRILQLLSKISEAVQTKIILVESLYVSDLLKFNLLIFKELNK